MKLVKHVLNHHFREQTKVEDKEYSEGTKIQTNHKVEEKLKFTINKFQ